MPIRLVPKSERLSFRSAKTGKPIKVVSTELVTPAPLATTRGEFYAQTVELALRLLIGGYFYFTDNYKIVRKN